MGTEIDITAVEGRFAEIIDRVIDRREQIIVRRRDGRAVAVAPIDAVSEQAPSQAECRRGILAAAGAWRDYPDPDGFLAELREGRPEDHR